MKLTKKDYKNLLKFYKIKTKKNISYKNLKKKGEKILASKLCKCIKKVNSKNENISIPICKSSIFNKKNLNIKKFTCKKNLSLLGLNKTKKILNINNKKKFVY